MRRYPLLTPLLTLAVGGNRSGGKLTELITDTTKTTGTANPRMTVQQIAEEPFKRHNFWVLSRFWRHKTFSVDVYRHPHHQ